MKAIKILLIAITFFLTGCAQVPKESVELSATVGRDLAKIKESHINFVDLYYTNLMNDINSFIDNVYLPYQVQRTLADDLWRNQMLSAIESASRSDLSGSSQIEAFEKIEAFLLIIQEEVEAYRKLKLKPVKEQYASVMSDINASYDQVHYANAIVTGHLASVVKVHNAQDELLEKTDLRGLRIDVGKGLGSLSDSIEELVQKAESGEEDLNSVISEFEGLLSDRD